MYPPHNVFGLALLEDPAAATREHLCSARADGASSNVALQRTNATNWSAECYRSRGEPDPLYLPLFGAAGQGFMPGTPKRNPVQWHKNRRKGVPRGIAVGNSRRRRN